MPYLKYHQHHSQQQQRAVRDKNYKKITRSENALHMVKPATTAGSSYQPPTDTSIPQTDHTPRKKIDTGPAIHLKGYWVIGGHSSASSMIRKCTICIKLPAKTTGQQKAPSPRKGDTTHTTIHILGM